MSEPKASTFRSAACLWISVALAPAAAFGQFGQVDLSQIGQLTRGGTATVKSLTLQAESPRVRPLGSTVIQVKVYGSFLGKDGQSKDGRLQQAGWTVRAAAADGGWLSKPFRFQGKDTESFVDTQTGGLSSIFQTTAGQYTVKDSVVYHAPAKAGKYKVQATIGAVSGEVEIEVDANAPAQFPPQGYTFGAEPVLEDGYRRLAEHYSPFVAQETWFQWTADALTRSDFDDDWDAANNWDNLGKGSTQAYVYYAAIESQSHWFLIYNFFHARDYSDNCVAGTCHENDNEGMVLAVRKDGSEFGKLETMETLAHNNVYSYVNDRAIRRGAHTIEGVIALHDGSHPMVFLEAGGHGALGATDKKSLFDPAAKTWRVNTGITYFYKGIAERPKSGVDREVGYELLPIYHHWWARARRDTAESLLGAFYRYQPFGNRPGMKLAEVAGAFAGKEFGEDKAKPFWGWHDNATQKDRILATGQWATDPAYAVSSDLTFPASSGVSLEYVFNPYLNTPDVPFFPVIRNLQNGEVAPGAPYRGAAPQASQAPDDSTRAPLTPAVPEQPSSGSCEVEVRVDGTVFLSFNGTVPSFEVMNGAAPETRKATCTTPPPSNAEFAVERRSGRGSVRLTDPRSPRVEISDPSRGAADYKLLLRWERR
jgi:hypothetical protein